MHLDDFQFDLPDVLIARRPVSPRDACRLLHLHRQDGRFEDRHFTDITGLLRAGDLLVLNDTRVVPARLYGRKLSGGAVEVLMERITGPDAMLAQVRASKSPAAGTVIRVGEEDGMEVRVEGRDGEFFLLRSVDGTPVLEMLARHGHVPIPPYLGREDDDRDHADYQTVFARQPGAVAAPTAGLHFTEELLAGLGARGVETGYLTLHVGAGTFQPVRCEQVEQHVMHREWFEIPARLADQVAGARARGGRVVAVGTTSVRALESAAVDDGIRAGASDTAVFIYPGYRFRVVDALVTNFHLPGSTLLMLVSAFAGRENVLDAYRHAVAEGYRFFSYGDAMFIA